MSNVILDDVSGKTFEFDDTVPVSKIKSSLSDFNNGTITDPTKSFIGGIEANLKSATGIDITQPINAVKSAWSGAQTGLASMIAPAYNFVNKIPFIGEGAEYDQPSVAEQTAARKSSPLGYIAGNVGGMIGGAAGIGGLFGPAMAALGEVPELASIGAKLTEIIKAGGIAGKATEMGVGAAEQAAQFGAINASSSVNQQEQAYGDIDWHEVGKEALGGIEMGAASGAVTKMFGKSLEDIIKQSATPDMAVKAYTEQVAKNFLTQAGIGYAMTRAGGGTHEEGVFTGVLFGGMGLLHTHGEYQSVRDGVITDLYSAYGNLFKAEFPQAAEGVPEQYVHEAIRTKAQEVLAKYQAKADELTAKVKAEAELPKDLQPAPSTGIEVNVTKEGLSPAEIEGAQYTVKSDLKDGGHDVGTIDAAMNSFRNDGKTFEQFLKWIKDSTDNKDSNVFTRVFRINLEAIYNNGHNLAQEEQSTGISVNVTPEMKAEEAKPEAPVTPAPIEQFPAVDIVASSPEMTKELIKTVVEEASGVNETGEVSATSKEGVSQEASAGDKTAKAAKDINKKIVDQGVAELPESELAKYESTSYKKQAEDFAELMTSDHQAAKDMATGKRAFPDGINPQLGFNAVKIKAILDGDMELVKELAKSPVATARSQAAQELGSAGHDNGMKEADPIKAVNDIVSARSESSKQLAQKVIDLEKKLSDAEKKLSETTVRKSSEKASKSVKSKEFGSKNKLVTKEMLEEAKKNFFSIGKIRGSAFGVDIVAEKLIEAGKIGTFYFEGGVRNFAEWSKTMTDLLGKEIAPHLKDLWKKTSKSFYKAERKEILEKMTIAMAEKESVTDMGGRIQKLAENLVADGVSDRKSLVDKMHKMLVDIDPNITKREVADAISGYGKFKTLNPDEIKATLRDLKGQLQNVSKLEDLNNKKAPLKTGVERRTPSDEERALIKQVEEAKKKYGIETTDPAKQLKSALDTVKTRLNNQIADLEKQIGDNRKIVREKNSVVLDKEAQDLTAKRDALKKQFDRIFGKPKMTDEQRINTATKAVERSIADLEKRIKAGDIAPKGTTGVMVSTPELEALRAKREALRKDLQDLRDIANPPKSDLQILKDRLTRQSADLEKKLAGMDFAAKEKKQQPADAESDKQQAKVEQLRMAYKAAKDVSEGITDAEVKAIVEMSKKIYEAKAKMKPNFTFENKQDGLDYGASLVAFNKYVSKMKNDAKKTEFVNPLNEKNTGDKYHAFVEDFKIVFNFVAENTRSIIASMDNSFWFRQGFKALVNPAHTKAWADNFVQSWKDIGQTLKGNIGNESVKDMLMGKDAVQRGEAIIDAVKAEIYSRPNYLNGRYEMGKKLDVGVNEEAYPTSWPSKVPLLGRLFKASETAYEAGAMRLRVDIADKMYEMAEKSGVDMKDKKQVGDINEVVNSMTGRGRVALSEGKSKAINNVFFSIKFLKSNIDTLTLHQGRLSAFATKQAAINVLSVVSTVGVTLAIAKALNPDSTDLDPRGSLFGKIKIGKSVPIDITAGMGGLVHLVARLMPTMHDGEWGQYTKNSKTGITKKLGEGFGTPNGMDVLMNFTTGKFSPMFATLRDIVKQKDMQGKKPTALSVASNLVTPIPVSNAFQLKDESAAVAIASELLDAVGFNANPGAYEKDWGESTGKELKQFKAKVGEERFKEANQKFNDRYNAKIDQIVDSPKYKALSDENKQKILTEEQAKIKDKVFREYNFRYKQERQQRLPRI